MIGPDRIFSVSITRRRKRCIPIWTRSAPTLSLLSDAWSPNWSRQVAAISTSMRRALLPTPIRRRLRPCGRGRDPEANFARSIAAEAAVVSGFDNVTFGIHLCRGNQRSMWHREGTYDAVAERLFNELPHDRFLLEYDLPRAGGFEPLRYVPKGKIVVLGLVSTKVPELESVDDLKRRIDAAAKFVPLDQLALSPQCGFASDVVGNLISEDDQKRKLERVVETARQVWGHE